MFGPLLLRGRRGEGEFVSHATQRDFLGSSQTCDPIR
jgi:hypothetical protein